MAAVRGCLGKVYTSVTSGTPAEVADVTEWSFDATAENLDASVMGACTKEFVAGPVETSGQVVCNWAGDPFASFDAEQVLLGAVGTNVKLVLYPAGVTIGDTKYTANSALITSVRHGASVQGFVQSTFGFFVNGAFVASAAT